ncbi:gastrin/cholecystokinin type B receptor [Drosophila obscura]|uniref:gastrin/cholecystokinin type B receptor n=1 Tax=Drosophila obscura TaxID=7282 RepID=UPI001BB0F07A|nr:gastrin/cholecystokinin type B receptor [Drosophila obscura]
MALLLYTWKQLEPYLKWALGKNTTVTESPAREPYPGIFVGDLSQLNRLKRNAFMCVVGVLFLMAFFGNLSTIYVNTRRKLRPFFRSCLLSLAFSDLVSSVFCSVSYIAQFHAEYLQLWTIGSFMCRVVPFVTTTSVLSGSLSLVAIATDRYLAVMRPVLGFWNPDIRFSCLCVALIWLCSIGASAPLLGIYGYHKVYLLELETENPPQQTTDDGETDEKLEVTELELVSMCLASDHNEGLFYVMLFTLIFLPCIVSFLWLNTVIARQLWVRRHYHQQQQEQQQERQPDQEGKFKSLPASNADLLMPSTLASAMGVALPFVMHKPALPSIPPSPQAPRSTTNQAPVGGMGPAAQAREARHRRMVVVVLLMMAVFIFLRLPAWIFLIMRLYGSYSEPVDWLLYFSFGILNLLSCALNPLFYTFLTQTIRTVSLLKQKTMDLLCCRHPGRGQDGAMPTEHSQPAKPCSLCWWCCCGLPQLTITWRCYPAHDPPPTTEVRQVEQSAQRQVEMEADPSNLQRVFSFKHDVFTVYNRRDDSQSASIESSA